MAIDPKTAMMIANAVAGQSNKDKGKTAGCCLTAALFIVFIPFIILVTIIGYIMQPAEAIKDWFDSLGPEEKIMVYQISPESYAMLTQSGKPFAAPINRNIQKYFTENHPYIEYNADGDNIYAVADGEVWMITNDYHVWIRHETPKELEDKGWYFYSHYWQVNIAPEIYAHSVDGSGAEVEKGDIIGTAMEGSPTDPTDVRIFCFRFEDDYFDDGVVYVGEEELYFDPEEFIAIWEGQETDSKLIWE